MVRRKCPPDIGQIIPLVQVSADKDYRQQRAFTNTRRHSRPRRRRLRAPGVAIPDYLLAHVAPLVRRAYSDPGQQDGDIPSRQSLRNPGGLSTHDEGRAGRCRLYRQQSLPPSVRELHLLAWGATTNWFPLPAARRRTLWLHIRSSDLSRRRRWLQCRDLVCARNNPVPSCGSADPDTARASQYQQAVEDVDSSLHLRGAMPLWPRT
jgi:hypothetical protein